MNYLIKNGKMTDAFRINEDYPAFYKLEDLLSPPKSTIQDEIRSEVKETKHKIDETRSEVKDQVEKLHDKMEVFKEDLTLLKKQMAGIKISIEDTKKTKTCSI